MKKAFTPLSRLQFCRGLRHIIILKQEIIIRLFLLEIKAFSVMLGYFQILTGMLDYKHSGNKLADKKKRSVSYCCSRATLKWIGRRSRYVTLPWQTNFCRISSKRGPASFFADEPKSINVELFEYSRLMLFIDFPQRNMYLELHVRAWNGNILLETARILQCKNKPRLISRTD